MILGKPNDQHMVSQFETLKKIFGIRRFALFPQPLADGRWVWLQHYYEHYDFWWVEDKFHLPSRAGDTYVPAITNYPMRQNISDKLTSAENSKVLQAFIDAHPELRQYAT